MKKFAITIAIIFSTFAAQAKDIKCKIIDPNSGFIGVIAFSLNESKKTFKLFALDGTNQILADENYGIIYQFKNKEFKYNKNGNLVVVDIVNTESYASKWRIALDMSSASIILKSPDSEGWGTHNGRCELMSNKL